MTRTVQAAVITILVTALLLVTASFSLAAFGPFTPGSSFYGIQDFTEQAFSFLVWDESSQADYFLSLADRRANDLARLSLGSHETDGLLALDKAIQGAYQKISRLPANNRQAYFSRVKSLNDKAQAVVLGLMITKDQYPEAFAQLQSDLSALINIDQELAIRTEPDLIQGNTTFQHSSAGSIACANCHSQDEPANHYGNQCTACHNPDSWKSTRFDHTAANATDCQSCHADIVPANHYQGQCSACHTAGTSWKEATFNHQVANATDCQSCHADKRPANHYSGNCSSCHNPSGWQNATFNHKAAGANDCQSCHADKRPANHYSGNCSSCHNPSGWQNATFNHKAAGATDCRSCHASQRPTNHSQEQCSNCHSTSSWSAANFTHTFPINHNGANGNCSKCHPSGTGSWTCYTCHNKAETEKHHAEKNITDIAARCIACHPKGGGD